MRSGGERFSAHPLLTSANVGRRSGGGLLNRRLRVASSDDARDQTEQPSQRRFGQAALETSARLAAPETPEADGNAQAPLRGDVAAVNELKPCVGGNTGDRCQESSEQGGGRDLGGGDP